MESTFFLNFSANEYTNIEAYSGMSDGLSESGGRLMLKTDILKNRSLLKRPSRISSSRFLLVAEIMRTSHFMGFVSPTLTNSPLSSTRRSLACRGVGISPISSRKSVPPSASSKKPFLSFTAPVKAPAL